MRMGTQLTKNFFHNVKCVSITKNLGIEKPGSIRFFDAKGEIMDRSEFLIGVEYEEADFEGGLGIHETGNRGTKHGLNM